MKLLLLGWPISAEFCAEGTGLMPSEYACINTLQTCKGLKNYNMSDFAAQNSTHIVVKLFEF